MSLTLKFPVFIYSAMNWRVLRFGEVSSTQEVAREHAVPDGLEWLVVVAETQSVGRGSRGREWQSRSGGLYMTVILKPEGHIGLVPLLAGVSVSEAISEVAGFEAQLKWPNDVLLHGKKVGGILVESVWSGGTLRFILLGVGVNVNNDLPDALPEATSLSKELGWEVDLDPLMHSILERLERHFNKLPLDPELVLCSWKKRNQTLGRRVVVTDRSGEPIEGIATDVDLEGALLVETDRGLRRVLSGRI